MATIGPMTRLPVALVGPVGWGWVGAIAFALQPAIRAEFEALLQSSRSVKKAAPKP